MKFDGVSRRVPPAAMKGTSVFTGSEVYILPHVNTGIVGVGHVKIDVDGGSVEAGSIPLHVKVFAGGNILVHSRGLVEAAGGAGYKSMVR